MSRDTGAPCQEEEEEEEEVEVDDCLHFINAKLVNVARSRLVTPLILPAIAS